MEGEHKYMNAPEVAEVLRIAGSRAYELVAESEILAGKISCGVRVSYKELDC